jgi:RNA polymerase sigma-70 factor, ECF subfamily
MHAIGRESLMELIDGLSQAQREVLTLKFAFGFSNADVAAILGKREGAIKSLQHRAFVTLQKQLATA